MRCCAVLRLHSVPSSPPHLNLLTGQGLRAARGADGKRGEEDAGLDLQHEQQLTFDQCCWQQQQTWPGQPCQSSYVARVKGGLSWVVAAYVDAYDFGGGAICLSTGCAYSIFSCSICKSEVVPLLGSCGWFCLFRAHRAGNCFAS